MQPSTSTPPAPKATSARLPATVIVLGALMALLAVGALQGGIAMVTDPLEPLGMPTDFLAGSPVDTYLWPGIFLLGIAGASLLVIAGTMGWRWRWAHDIEAAVGYRWPWIGAVATGLVLLAFEIAELFIVPFHPVMHPLLLAGSVAIVILAVTPSARAFFRLRPPPDHLSGGPAHG